jgi:hypothetical protein
MNLPAEDIVKSSLEIARDKAEKRNEAIQNIQAQADAQSQRAGRPQGEKVIGGLPSGQGAAGTNLEAINAPKGLSLTQ